MGKKRFFTLILALLIAIQPFITSIGVLAVGTGVQSDFTFNKTEFYANDVIELSLKLTGLQGTEATNAAEFFIGYDANAVELQTNNADADIENGYIPFGTKVNNINQHFITASYFDVNGSTALQNDQNILTARFKVKETATPGKISFTLLTDTNIGTDGEPIVLNGGQAYSEEVTIRGIELTTLTLSGEVAPQEVNSTIDLSTLTLSGIDQFNRPYDLTNQTITWVSSDTNVATVDGSTLTAVEPGTTNVKAVIETTIGTELRIIESNTIPVTVKAPELNSINIVEESPITLGLNGTKTLTLVGTLTSGVQATPQELSGVTWSSSNTGVATVDNGLVTAVGVGTTTIEARSSATVFDTIVFNVIAVPTPRATKQTGTYYSKTPLNIEFDNVEGFETYYTLDGSEPSKTNGAQYTGSFTITGTKTVKAISYNGDNAGTVATYNYNFADFGVVEPNVPSGDKFASDFELELTKPASNTDTKAQYRIGETGTWADYTTPIHILDPVKIYVKLVSVLEPSVESTPVSFEYNFDQTYLSVRSAMDSLTNMANLTDQQLAFLVTKADAMIDSELFADEIAKFEAKGVTKAELKSILTPVRNKLITDVTNFKAQVKAQNYTYLVAFAEEMKTAIPQEVKDALVRHGLTEEDIVFTGLDLLSSGVDFFNLDENGRTAVENVLYKRATEQDKQWLSSYGINFANLEAFLGSLTDSEVETLQNIMESMSSSYIVPPTIDLPSGTYVNTQIVTISNATTTGTVKFIKTEQELTQTGSELANYILTNGTTYTSAITLAKGTEVKNYYIYAVRELNTKSSTAVMAHYVILPNVATVSSVTVSGGNSSDSVQYLNAGDKLTLEVALTYPNPNGLSVTIGDWKTLTASNFVKQTDGKYKYEYTVLATDNLKASNVTATLNGSSKTATNKVVIDNQAEITLVFSPQNNAVLGKGKDVKVIALTEASAKTVTLEIGGTTVTLTKTVPGMYEGTYTIPATAVSGVMTGNVTLEDLAGNTATKTNQVSVSVDVDAPVITGAVIGEPNKATAPLTATITDNNISKVKVYKVLKENKALVQSNFNPATGDLTATVALLNGDNKFEIVAVDKAGNESKAAISKLFDNKAPDFKITVDAENNVSVVATESIPAGVTATLNGDNFVLAADQDNPTTTWTGELPTDLSKYELIVKGKDNAQNQGIGIYSATQVGSDGATIGGQEIKILIPAGALSGTKKIEVQDDTTVNTSSLEDLGTQISKAINFKPDGTVFDHDINITIPYDSNITDLSKIVILYYDIDDIDQDGVIWENYTEKILDYYPDGDPTKDPFANGRIPTGIDTDNYTVTFKTNHFSTYGSATDTTAPILTINSPADNDIKSTPTITVTGTTEVNAQGIDISVKVGNGVPVTTTTTNGAYIVQVTLAENANNTITVEATDPSNNKSTETVTVTHDGTLPVINVTSPTTTTTTNSTVTVTGSITPKNSIVAANWALGVTGEDLLPNLGTNGEFEFTVTLVDGQNDIVITAASPAGVSTETITINKTEPQQPPTGGGGGGGGGAVIPKTDTTKFDDKKVDEQIASGKTEITVEAAKGKAVITAAALNKVNEAKKDLVVKADGVTFKLPAGALAATGSADIQLTAEGLGNNTTKLSSEYKAVGQVYEFNATSGSSAVKFQKPIKVALSFDGLDLKATDIEKLGVYLLNESTGKWGFVGGKVNTQTKMIEFTTTHFSKYTIMTYNKAFSDVVNHWAKADIELMASKHVIGGTSETTYSPDRAITRAEFTALLVRALGIETNSNATVAFNDVNSSAWYHDVVATAYKAGLVGGLSATEFAPNANITREQMAVMVTRAMEYAGVNVDYAEATLNFADASDVSTWAQTGVATASKLGIVNGRTATTFVPKANATRAESAVMIKRMYVQLP